MDIAQIIIHALVTLLGAGGIALVLREQIKSQKSQMDSMKLNIASMKSYMDLINFEDLKQYVEVIKEKANLEAEVTSTKTVKEFLQSEKAKDLTEKLLSEALETNELVSKYEELFLGICDFYSTLPEEPRNMMLDKFFPQNAADIRETIENVTPESSEFLEERRELFERALNDAGFDE